MAPANLFVAEQLGKLVEYVAVGGSLPASPVVRQIATLNGPQSIAVDLSGNIYVADAGAIKVYEFQPVNGVIPIGATPLSLGSGYSSLFGIAVDTAGDVFVTDFTQKKVLELVAVAGQVPTNVTPTVIASNLTSLLGLSVDRLGNLFVSNNASGSVL